jgi:hypothetical protein
MPVKLTRDASMRFWAPKAFFERPMHTWGAMAGSRAQDFTWSLATCKALSFSF